MGAWRAYVRLQERAAANYLPDERVAFMAGYGKGYRGCERATGIHYLRNPNAYNAGYWEGVADKAEAD